MKHIKPLVTMPTVAQSAPPEAWKLYQLFVFAIFQPVLCEVDVKGKFEDLDFSKCSQT